MDGAKIAVSPKWGRSRLKKLSAELHNLGITGQWDDARTLDGRHLFGLTGPVAVPGRPNLLRELNAAVKSANAELHALELAVDHLDTDAEAELRYFVPRMILNGARSVETHGNTIYMNGPGSTYRTRRAPNKPFEKIIGPGMKIAIYAHRPSKLRPHDDRQVFHRELVLGRGALARIGVKSFADAAELLAPLKHAAAWDRFTSLATVDVSAWHRLTHPTCPVDEHRCFADAIDEKHRTRTMTRAAAQCAVIAAELQLGTRRPSFDRDPRTDAFLKCEDWPPASIERDHGNESNLTPDARSRGGRSRARRMTAEERSEHARMMAKARWGRR